MRFNDQMPAQPVPLSSQAGVLLWDWPATLNSVEIKVKHAHGRWSGPIYPQCLVDLL